MGRGGVEQNSKYTSIKLMVNNNKFLVDGETQAWSGYYIKTYHPTNDKTRHPELIIIIVIKIIIKNYSLLATKWPCRDYNT